jgi:hypothetical protein
MSLPYPTRHRPGEGAGLPSGQGERPQVASVRRGLLPAHLGPPHLPGLPARRRGGGAVCGPDGERRRVPGGAGPPLRGPAHGLSQGLSVEGGRLRGSTTRALESHPAPPHLGQVEHHALVPPVAQDCHRDPRRLRGPDRPAPGDDDLGALLQPRGQGLPGRPLEPGGARRVGPVPEYLSWRPRLAGSEGFADCFRAPAGALPRRHHQHRDGQPVQHRRDGTAQRQVGQEAVPVRAHHQQV